MAAELAVCERCGRERAFVRLSDSAGVRLLCQGCLPINLRERDCSFDLARFFVLLANPRAPGRLAAPDHQAADARCLVCGLTYQELADGGSMGCPACYEAFRSAILSGLQTLMG